MITTTDRPVRPGDVIEWRTWCGPTHATVAWIDQHGHAGLTSADGQTDYFEQLPDGTTVTLCATSGCTNPASWYSTREGNTAGSDAPRRCVACCDAIAERNLPPFGLFDVVQFAEWNSIAVELRSEGAIIGDYVRRVLVYTDKGTSLVPWFGPAPQGGSDG